MRAAIYARLSADRDGSGLAVERQQEDCQKLCDERGWDVVAVLVDNDMSATSGKRRPGFDEALRLLTDGTVDLLVAWHLDRLQRTPKDLERLLDAAQVSGGNVATVQAGDLDLSTPTGRALARTITAWALAEVEVKSVRQVRARRQSAEAGKTNTGGGRPFGYLEDKVTPHPVEGPALAGAVRTVAAGVSLAQIMREWTALGITPVRGGKWAYSSMTALLTRPRNAGLSIHQGRVVGVGQWAPLVTQDEHYLVCAVLANPDRRTTTTPEARWLMSGIGRCGECGDTLTTGSARSRGITTRTYMCASGKPHGARKADRVDEYVADVVVARLSRPDAAALLEAPARNSGPLLDESAELTTRMDRALADYTDGLLTASELRDVKDRLSQQQRGVASRLARLTTTPVLTSLPTSREVWDALPLARRRAVVRALLRVSLHKRASEHGDEPYGCFIEWVVGDTRSSA